MQLSAFIQKNRKKIVNEWVKFARTLHPWAAGLNKSALRDHAEELLLLVVTDMRTSQTKHEQGEKSKGHDAGGPLGRVGRKHAIERLQGGLRLDQLVAEFRALRATVLRLWEEAQGDHQGEMTRFNEAIDETLAESAVWYTEAVAHAREQFLGILGHDLRNPLASIIMNAAMLTRSETLDVKQLGVATRMANSGARMNRMINDLLDLTRTRLGSGIPVTCTPMDLATVCEQVFAELASIHPDYTLEHKSHGDLRGEWDSDRLTQVISNLVANALQYGGEHGPVRLTVEGKDDEVALCVHNAGPPITAHAMKTIFDPMARAPASAEQNPTGLGLGLYIADKIVAAHGGTLGVTSSVGAGTTFTVKLPRRPARKQARPTKQATPTKQRANKQATATKPARAKKRRAPPRSRTPRAR